MFENFLIPQTIEECAAYYYNNYDVQEKLQEIIASNKLGRFVWHANNGFDTMGRIIQLLYAAEIEDEDNISFRYYCNNLYRLTEQSCRADIYSYGIVINEEAGTHFREIDYPGAIHLTGAEEMLKQSPLHFLRLFTMPENHMLYVYTNKMLEPPILYKLIALNIALYNKKNNTQITIAGNFVNSLITNDSAKAVQTLNDFLNSDIVTEHELKELSKILRSTNDNKIRKLERTIEQNRSTISDYENTIAQMATQIRESNLELEFLRSIDDSEEHKLFFKYLKKHPYIFSFSPKRDQTLELKYRAPIVYFNETPARKYLTKPIQTEWKQVIEIILGGKYELWTKCMLKFNTSNFQVTALTMNKDDDLLNHPHIDRFHCFGNHRQAIQDSAEAGDYIGAIEQLSQAVLNLNFYDGCVIEEMLKNIKARWSTLVTWYCKETGELLTTKQVVERGDYYEEA